MSDKKISELTEAAVINQTDVSVLVSGDMDYRFAFSTLLQFLGNNLNVGANISFGIALPQNTSGKNGDLFINTTTGSFAQKISGTWSVVYSLPSNNTQTDTTVLYGLGVPGTSTGNNGDTYIHTGTGVFYKKSVGSWSQVFSMQTGPQGPQGTAGTNGTNGTNGFSVLNGPGNPSNLTTGANGDFYINTSNYNFFGPKTDGDWGDGVSLIPPGISPGGTVGQALIKNSDADYDIEWFDFDTLYVKLGGSYSNPSWINSLTWNKITGAPTTISGYGITDYNSLGDARWLQQSGGTVTGDIQSTFSAFSSTSFITKNYVDNIITGVIWVGADAATTTNIPLSGEQTVDSVTTSSSRVFVKNQTDQTQNGIYITSTGAWMRATDADTGTKITRLAIIIEGGSQKGNQWVNTNSSIAIGTTNITFAQSSGLGTYTNGLGIALVANVFSLDLAYVDARYQPLENQRLSTTNSPTFAKVVADTRGVGAGYNSTANHVLIANSTDNISTNVYPVLVNRSQTTLTTGYGTGILFADQTVALGKILLVRHNSADNWDSEMRFYVRMRNGGYTTDPEVNQVLALTLNNDASATFGGAITGAGKITTTLTTEQFRLNYDATHYVSHTVDAIGNYTIAPAGGATNITGFLNTTTGIVIQALGNNVYEFLPNIPSRGTTGFALRDNTAGVNLFYIDRGSTTVAFPGAISSAGLTSSGGIVANGGLALPSGQAINFDNGSSSAYYIYKSGTTLLFGSGGDFSFNSNIFVPNVIASYANNTGNGNTYTLTRASAYRQNINGAGCTVVLPVVSTLNVGFQYEIIANNVMPVNSSGGNLVYLLAAGQTIVFTCISTSGTTAASWSVSSRTFADLTVRANVVTDGWGFQANGSGTRIWQTGTGGTIITNKSVLSVANWTATEPTFNNGTTSYLNFDSYAKMMQGNNYVFGPGLGVSIMGGGFVAKVGQSTSTNTSNAVGVYGGAVNQESTPAINQNGTNVTGGLFYAENNNLLTAGTAITRAIYAKAVSTGTSIPYAIYSDGGLNYFSGRTLLNTLTDDGVNALQVNGNGAFTGLIYSTSATPTISVTGAGTGATINISGSNQKQIIQITTGTSPSNMAITVTMSGGFAYPHSCVPVVSALSSSAQTLGWYVSSLGANTYSMYTGATTASTVYYYTVDNGGY